MQVHLKCRTAPVQALAGKVYTKNVCKFTHLCRAPLNQLNLNDFLLKVALYH